MVVGLLAFQEVLGELDQDMALPLLQPETHPTQEQQQPMVPASVG